MIYLKSALAGMVAVLATGILTRFGTAAYRLIANWSSGAWRPGGILPLLQNR
jgi:hypothetical protein